MLWIITITDKVKIHPELESQYQISSSDLSDTLTVAAIEAIRPQEIKGVMVTYRPGLFTAYYEYKADHTKVLQAIASLPSYISNEPSDLQCMPANSQVAFVSTNELLVLNDALSFFFKSNPDQFVAFTCRKYPYKHTLLLDTRSQRVLHKVETI